MKKGLSGGFINILKACKKTLILDHIMVPDSNIKGHLVRVVRVVTFSSSCSFTGLYLRSVLSFFFETIIACTGMCNTLALYSF